MKKWLISLITLTFSLATVGVVAGFTLTGGGDDSQRTDPPVEDTLHVDPTYDEWILDFGDGIGDGKVVTSIDDIDPNECNYIHNINACTAEELEELGNLAAISWIVDPDTVVEGEPEPIFVDGEPVTIQECDLAGGTFWASSDGKVGCDIVNDLDGGGEDETQAQPPAIVPTPS